MPNDAIQCKSLEVAVGDKGIERAIKHLKRKLASEGILRELKNRRHYLKPSVKRRKKEAEAARRRRKRARSDGDRGLSNPPRRSKDRAISPQTEPMAEQNRQSANPKA